MEQPASLGRRRVLKWLSAGLAAGVGAVVALPGIGMLLRSRRAPGLAESPRVRAGALSALREGEPQLVALVGSRRDAWSREDEVVLGACWLVRRERAVRAFSNACPHLGCGIQWEPRRQRFSCPCHASTFALDGRLLTGPSPRGMDELQVELAGDEIHVRFQQHRTGARRGEPKT